MIRQFIIGFLLLLSSHLYSADTNVLDFGAKKDGLVLTTSDIQRAIDACFASGGGTVTVPPGEYLISTLNLKSNVEFRIMQGAVLKATTDLSQYQIHNEQPAGLFYTEYADNVSITGSGIIHGQGMEFMYTDSAKVIIGDVNNYIFR
jgi:polygalacturonase